MKIPIETTEADARKLIDTIGDQDNFCRDFATWISEAFECDRRIAFVAIENEATYQIMTRHGKNHAKGRQQACGNVLRWLFEPTTDRDIDFSDMTKLADSVYRLTVSQLLSLLIARAKRAKDAQARQAQRELAQERPWQNASCDMDHYNQLALHNDQTHEDVVLADLGFVERLGIDRELVLSAGQKFMSLLVASLNLNGCKTLKAGRK